MIVRAQTRIDKKITLQTDRLIDRIVTEGADGLKGRKRLNEFVFLILSRR